MEVIDFNEIHKKKIEEKAYENFDIIKIEDDSYLINDNNAFSNEIEYDFIDDNRFTEELATKIRELSCCEGDCITVTIRYYENEENNVLEVINLSNEDIIEINTNMNLDYDTRRKIVNFIVYNLEEDDINVSFYLHYNFELLRDLVESISE